MPTPKSLSEGVLLQYANSVGAISEANGFTYVDGSLMASVVQRMAITAVLAKTWVVPGVAGTEELVEGIDPNKIWSVWVEIQGNIGPSTRTLGTGGTTGNNGLINYAPAIVVTTTPLEVKLTQVDDQPLFFPRMQLETMRYDKISTTMTNFLDNMVVSKATYETAVMIAYAHYRASAAWAASFGSGSTGTLPPAQFILIDTTKVYDENYMIKVINEMDEAMSNGDLEMGAMTFGGPRALLARINVLNWFKTPKTGFVNVAGSNEAFKLLMEPSFDTENLSVFGGTTEQYRGEMRGYDFYEIPKNAFTWISAWLGLTDTQIAGVLGIITSPLQFAMGGYSDPNMIMKEQAAPYPGVYASPYRKFGARGYRNIILLVDSAYIPVASLIGAKDAPILTPKEVVAPLNWAISTKTVVENTLSNGPSLAFIDPVNGKTSS